MNNNKRCDWFESTNEIWFELTNEMWFEFIIKQNIKWNK